MEVGSGMDEVIEQSTILTVSGLTKSFGEFVANDHISFELRRGEIHCLLGENGAGKSTFTKCLYGAYRPDSGSVKIDCVDVEFSSPRDAIKHGIGMVHQHFVLVPTMNVVENIVVGSEIRGISPGIQKAAEKVSALCTKYGVELDPYAPISSLSVGEQQWVEILKALFSGVEILILDEPTAALTPQESDRLFSILRQMTSDRTAIIFITHKLNEVMAVSDRTTVFRRGEVIATVETADISKAELARLMVGRGVNFSVGKEAQDPAEAVLEIKDLRCLRDNKREALKGINLTIRRKEILGIAGVGGNGQDELFDVAVGVRKPTRGDIVLAGKSIKNCTPGAIAARGLAHIPPDRIQQGLMGEFSVAENLLLGNQRSQDFRKYLLTDDRKIEENAQRLIEEYDVSTTGPDQMASNLSGGNLQKLILARELSRPIECVIASCPTRGLDVGAIEYVHRRLIEIRDAGVGVLLISEDLDEIFNVADRIAVIFQGEIMGEFNPGEVTREQIGLLMAGAKDEV
jgi:general nucleoside transport system ATP-binding protein